MISDSIIDSRLFIRLDLDLAVKHNSEFQSNVQKQAYLSNQLLLYDRIIIPTHDFGIVPVLISWLGIKNFEEALEQSVFKFLRNNRILCYTVGGLHEFTIERGGIKDWQWWQEAMFNNNIGTTIELQLAYMCPMILPKQREILVQKIEALSKAASLENDFFMKNVAHESYKDILENEKLCAYMSDCTRTINLEMLPEIDAYSVRVIRNEITDRVDLVLHIAKFNLELIMATQVDNADILTSEGAEEVLANKLRRAPLIEGFIKLLELNNIPDISLAVSSGHLGLPQVWELRQKSVAKQFRRWLREANPTDSRDIEKAYVQALKASPASHSLPIKMLRFAITNIVGVLNPVAGLLAGGVDSFFLDKFVSGFSPRLFLDKLSKLPNAKQ